MFFLNSEDDINNLVNLAQKKNKNIYAGISWYQKKDFQLINKNGVIIIDKKGNYIIEEKNHYLRFCETKNEFFYFNNNNKKYPNIYICSEFFLSKINLQKKNNIIIASTSWTNTPITFFYKNIMKRIYDIF
jgi:hypothetical protein